MGSAHGRQDGLTFLRRHEAHACWTCLRFTGRPPRVGSDATNLTLRAGAAAAAAEAGAGADMAAFSGSAGLLGV